MKMRTLSLFESEESKGLVSISELFEGANKSYFDLNDDYHLSDTAYLLCRGGWPLSVQDDKELGLEITKNYYDSLFVFENCYNEKFRNKNPEVIKMILRSYACNISTEAPNSSTMDVRTLMII